MPPRYLRVDTHHAAVDHARLQVHASTRWGEVAPGGDDARNEKGSLSLSLSLFGLTCGLPGCDPQPPDGEEDGGAPPVEPRFGFVPDDSASVPVGIEWEKPDTSGVVRLPATTRLVLRNATPIDVVLRVSLRSYGLETRTASRPLMDVRLAPNSERSIPVDLAELPIRSHGVPSSVYAEASYLQGRDTVHIASSRLSYEYDDAMTVVRLYSYSGRRFRLHHPDDPGLERRRMAELDSLMLRTRGAVFDPLRGYVPITRLPPVGDDLGLRVVGSVDFFERWPASLPPPGVDAPPPLMGRRSLCVHYTYRFVDAGFGEDHLASPEKGTAPARFGAYLVTRRDSNEPIASGFLGRNGCTPPLHLPASSPDQPTENLYVLTTASRQKRGDVLLEMHSEQNFDIGTEPSFEPVISYSRTYFFFTQNHLADTTHHLFPSPDYVVHNALSVGQAMLIMEDNGLTQGNIRLYTRDIQPGPFYDPTCKGLGGFASTDYATKSAFVCLGRNKAATNASEIWNYNTYYKYVIAHELGHVVQGLATENLSRNYSLDAALSVPLCRCDHVDSSNQAHCLQSQEGMGAGQSEGFAHFYAARILNKASEPDCRFVYYKEFLEPPSNQKKLPPYPVSCTQPVKWLETRCLAPNRAVEYDWMNFLYAINTAPSAATTLPDLYTIYLAACGGTGCESKNPTWAELQAAAVVHFGLGDPRATWFVDRGDAYGVNH